jgi:NADH-quinone oxidoreductase subunit M
LLLLVVPLLGAIVSALSAKESRLARASAMVAMLVVLALSLRIFLAYEPSADASRFDFNLPWMPMLGIHLHFAVDGFNVYLVLLAALLFPAVLGCTWDSAHTRRRLYLVLMLILESSLLGTLLSQNAVLFFVFWEAVLIPAGVLILVYGGERRRRAAITFFLYTMAGSVLLLAAVIALGVAALTQTGSWSFELSVLYGLRLDWNMQLFVFIAIMLACLVKAPLVPFHAWLPLAYYEAPASVTALMAGALSKMGVYGILKLALPLAPDVAAAAGPAMAALAVTSLLYGAVLALREDDYKKLIAYSSLSHMGYVVLGLFSLREVAIHGALLQMLSHGVAVAGLFMLLGVLEQRLGPSYLDATALSTAAPRFAIWWMLFVLTTVALPLTSGFTAEFLILFGAFAQGLAAWKGTAMYPDANFTLRVTYGRAAGYNSHGKAVPFATNLGDFVKLAQARGDTGDFALPRKLRQWLQSNSFEEFRRMPVDFVTTNDITGGNSGSATLNKSLEIVGLIFDGNEEAMAGDWTYSETAGRALSTDIRFALTIAREVHGAGWVVDELLKKSQPRSADPFDLPPPSGGSAPSLPGGVDPGTVTNNSTSSNPGE